MKNISHPPIFLAMLGATPLFAYAETSVSGEPGGGFSQVIFGLILVALLLAGSLYLLKRLAAPSGSSAALLRVISGASIGTRERVVIVEVGETWLVLGVAPGQISKLHELPRQNMASSGDAILPEHDFAAWLKKVVDRRNAH